MRGIPQAVVLQGQRQPCASGEKCFLLQLEAILKPL